MKIGDWIKVKRNGPAKHWSPAKVISICKDRVIVLPPRHKHTEVVDMKNCKPWKSRNSQKQRSKM